MRRKAGLVGGGGRVGGGTDGCTTVAAGAGWLCRKFDGGGGVNPGRDHATWEGGGGALERSAAGLGLALSLAVPTLGGGAELEAAAEGFWSFVSPWCSECAKVVGSFVESLPDGATATALALAAARACSSLNQSESSDSVLGRALGGPSEFDPVADGSNGAALASVLT